MNIAPPFSLSENELCILSDSGLHCKTILVLPPVVAPVHLNYQVQQLERFYVKTSASV